MNKLDNPVWFSLSESHSHFSVDFNETKFYHPDYCPFGGTVSANGISKHLEEYSALTDKFFVVGEAPGLPKHLKLEKELVCLQMVADKHIEVVTKENIVALDTTCEEDLFRLVNLVQPGYFKRKTALLGNYFGIYREEALVAVTGERMKMRDFVEVSAVVTHPDHRGKGFAGQLIAHTVNNIFEGSKTPYLHVAENNLKAINLYQALGFRTRRKISFWKIARN